LQIKKFITIFVVKKFVMEKIDKEKFIANIKAKVENEKAERENEKAERERRIREYWENLPKFTKPEDVPELPRVDADQWMNFYVPKLIEAGAIPKKNLVDGQYYAGEHRRATIAKWDATKNTFVYNRTKFNFTYEDDCNHFEDDDGYALFVPIRIATEEEYKINQEIK
jgi:hypothetical protein